MIRNNITIAPQCNDTDDLYELWMQENFGTEAQFYEFMTTPSLERTAFLSGLATEISVKDNYVMEVFSV